MNNDHFPKMPEGGQGRLRQLLDSLKEDQEKLNSHPIYKEGWDDGFQAAQESHRKLTKALSKIYNIDYDE
jgi:hypothetical protein